MKKTLVALAALGTFAGMAHAQSSVTLYGIVDAGMLYTNNVKGKSLWQLASGNESGSRWGLTGTEDLGGGLKAIFKLENGFNVNNGTLGQGGREFGRQAYVGLKSDTIGTFTMGRQYNAIQDYVAPLAVSSVLTQFATHPFDNDNLNNTFRTDNSVKYATPVIAGFQAEALYAFSNSTNFANNRAYSVGATYANGPLNLGAGYARAQQPGLVGGALIGNPSAATATTPSNPYSLSPSRLDQWGAGGTFAIGQVTVGLLYTGSLFTNAGSLQSGVMPKGTIHFQNYEGSVRYQLTPALVLALGETYTSVHQSGVSGHYLQTSGGAQYLLSKRTDVYANAFYQKASSNLQANIDAAGGAASGSSQLAVVVGIRHKF
ncbi:porin [Burkholderia stagnalis]